MIYVIAVAMVITGVLWCCLHRGKEEPVEIWKRERPPKGSVHEYMDLRLPDRK